MCVHVSMQAPTGVYTWKRMILTEVKQWQGESESQE